MQASIASARRRRPARSTRTPRDTRLVEAKAVRNKRRTHTQARERISLVSKDRDDGDHRRARVLTRRFVMACRAASFLRPCRAGIRRLGLVHSLIPKLIPKDASV